MFLKNHMFKGGQTPTDTALIYFEKYLHKPTTGWQPYCVIDMDSEYTGTATVIFPSHSLLSPPTSSPLIIIQGRRVSKSATVKFFCSLKRELARKSEANWAKKIPWIVVFTNKYTDGEESECMARRHSERSAKVALYYTSWWGLLNMQLYCRLKWLHKQSRVNRQRVRKFSDCKQNEQIQRRKQITTQPEMWTLFDHCQPEMYL